MRDNLLSKKSNDLIHYNQKKRRREEDPYNTVENKSQTQRRVDEQRDTKQ